MSKNRTGQIIGGMLFIFALAAYIIFDGYQRFETYRQHTGRAAVQSEDIVVANDFEMMGTIIDPTTGEKSSCKTLPESELQVVGRRDDYTLLRVQSNVRRGPMGWCAKNDEILLKQKDVDQLRADKKRGDAEKAKNLALLRGIKTE
jgi:hypothetical protein